MDVDRKYLNFQNYDNSCWLDACMIVIAHNETFRKTVNSFQKSQINKIIKDYHQALANVNDSPTKRNALKNSRNILHSLQNTTLNYLKEYLKFKNGEPESAFCALLNLIMHDKSPIKEHLNATWIWHKQCSNCSEYSTSVSKKVIITLPKVEEFNPAAPTTYYTCLCRKEQKMKGEFKEISDCLIFHFENGAGKRGTLPSQFSINKRNYYLTSIVLFQDSKGIDKDHFITIIRQPFVEKWLEFNDINETVVYFSEVKPEINLQNIYLSIYEAFDNLGKTKIGTFSNEDILPSNKYIETINLMDEDSLSTPTNSKMDIGNLASCVEETSIGSVNSETDTCKDQPFSDHSQAEPQEEADIKFGLNKEARNDVVEQTVAAFFGQIFSRKAKREAGIDSASSSGEENIMIATYNSHCRNYFDKKCYEPPSSTAMSSSSSPENEQFEVTNNQPQSDNSVSSDVDYKDQYFGDDCHAEPREETTIKFKQSPSLQLQSPFSCDATPVYKDQYFGDDSHAESKEEISIKNNKETRKKKIGDDSHADSQEGISIKNDKDDKETRKKIGDDSHADSQEGISSKDDKETRKKKIDAIIEKTFAAFFEQIIAIHEEKNNCQSSSSTDEQYNTVKTENEPPSSSTTNSSLCPGNAQFEITNDQQSQSDNSVSSDVTPCFSDDSHAERENKKRKSV